MEKSQDIHNQVSNCTMRDYIGGNQYILMFQDKEREFMVTHKVNIKPVSYFVGREQELKELRQRVEQGQKSILVSGMGGIGKTHICRKLFEEYSLKHKNKEMIPFEHIGYIEYNGDMGSSLVECLKYKEQEKAEQNLEAAWRELEYLASDGKLLLFVDNVNVSIRQDPGLKHLNSLPGAILLTSRRTSFSKEFEPYRIGFLTTEECKEIYENIRFEKRGQKVKEGEVSDLEYIIEHLAARHTLTVELLAHLAQTKDWTVKRLKEELEEKGFQLEYENEEEELINIQKSYEILYNLSELTEEEKNVLEAFSVFPYLPLSSEVCKEWLLPDIGEKEQEDIFKRLYRKGWLQEEQESYLLHPVFSQFIYEKCKPRLEKHKGLIEGCKKSLEIPENGVALECQKYIPFGESIAKKVGMEKELEQKNFLATLGYVLYYIGEYKKAEKWYKEVLGISEKLFGENRPDTASSYNNLAVAYKRQGEYEKAKVLYEKSLRIREEVLGENHPDTANSYNNLAGVYERQGEYEKAKVLYEKSLRIREEVLGENHPDTATSYNNLAGVYERQGEYKIALDYFFKSYKILILKFDFNYPYTQIVYENMKLTYTDWNPKGNFEEWLEGKMREVD